MKKTFAYHKPSEESLAKITELRNLFSSVSDKIDELCPDSREKSVSHTKLEELAMWAIKAVVCNDSTSEIALKGI